MKWRKLSARSQRRSERREKRSVQRFLDSPEVVHGFLLEDLYIILISSQILIRQFITKVLSSTEEDIRGIFVEKTVLVVDNIDVTEKLEQRDDLLHHKEAENSVFENFPPLAFINSGYSGVTL